jgi:hypothetical protein
MPEPTYTTPADEALFAAIGRLTISWALLEAGLDYSIIMLHKELGGDKIEPEMPWALKRKLKYIRKCFNRIDGLTQDRETVAKLLDNIDTASEARHDIIHGVATSHPEGATQVGMVRLLRGAETITAKHYTFTTKEILRRAADANKLAGLTLALAQWLKALIWPEERH